MNLRHVNRNEFKGGLNSKPEPNCWICAGGRLKNRILNRRELQRSYVFDANDPGMDISQEEFDAFMAAINT